MNQSEAKAVFTQKTKEIVEGIYDQIKKDAVQGQGSLIYYPPTIALLKSVRI